MREKELQIEEKIHLKQVQIQKLRDDISILEQELLEERTGFKEGDKVINNKGEKGILCFNRKYVSFWSWKKLKKDGLPSDSITYVNGDLKRLDS